MVSIDNISVVFGSFVLLDEVSFQVNNRDRIGLTGRNGAGKTTLLKIIAGHQKPSGGRVTGPSDLTVGYLPQQMVTVDDTSVFEETYRAFENVTLLDKEIKELTASIAIRNDYESNSYYKACDRLADLQEQYRIKGGDNIHAETEIALRGLGFRKEDFSRPTSQLSGGWRMRIELAKILLKKPSLILLDEPTNHLDIESIEWLENFLKNYAGEVILVSHDRAFLDNITNRTVEISLGKVYDYRVAYSEYLKLREERRQQQLAAWRNQKKMIGDTEQFIERFRYKSTKAVQVQSRIKQLNKLERIEIEEEDTNRINIRFAPAPRSGTIVVEGENISKAYGEKQILKNISLLIERGEKVAFVGRNGEGKTTLSRMIMDETDYEGHIKKGHNLNIGYFAQNQASLLDENLSVFETIDNVATGDIRTKIRDILGAFLFGGDDIEKKVSVLSGGERSRLAMIRLLLEPYNLLLLDEPTNHLDLRSKDILKQALDDYDGTLIVVSHDRDFLNGLVDRIYEFGDMKVKEHRCSIYEFLAKKKMMSFRELEKKQHRKDEHPKQKKQESKQLYLERKELEKRTRKIEKEASRLEEEIEKLEDLKSEMEQIMNSASKDLANSDQTIYTRYENIGKEIEEKMMQWEDVSRKLENIKNGDQK